jgi:GWxTD domain-containing protein
MLADSLVITDVTKSLEEISPTQKFTKQTNLQLAPGDYKIVSRLTDLVSKKSVTATETLKLVAFPGESLKISDIQLASDIVKQPKAENKFDKNGLRVVPNASGVYGTNFLNLFYYTEVYNLSYNDNNKNSTFRANYLVIGENEKIVKQARGNARKKPGATAVINGSFDLADLTSGFYTFRIEVIDDLNNKKVVAEKNFSIYNLKDFVAKKSTVKISQKAQFSNEFKNMSEFELNDYFKKLTYIAKKDEKKVFKKLDINGKRNFLAEFWARRDPNPDTIINEEKQRYFKLLAIANSNYSQGMKAGWKTDRARILLIYGQPDEIERHPSSDAFKEYQIWYYYNIRGGVKFYFVDFRRTGDLMLVHSTHPDEVQQYEWKELYGKL